MSKHTELPSETDGSNADFNLDPDPPLGRTPIRFGRLALWVASASALAIGIMGTVAYGLVQSGSTHLRGSHGTRAADALARGNRCAGTDSGGATNALVRALVRLRRGVLDSFSPSCRRQHRSERARALPSVRSRRNAF